MKQCNALTKQMRRHSCKHYERQVRMLRTSAKRCATVKSCTWISWRDPDVLDTWFSSALWPFSTLGWPDKTPELKRYYPTSVLVTALRHHLLLGRPHDDDGHPFHGRRAVPRVFIHTRVLDEKGAKMSKTKGNVVDPLELIDAIRRRRAALHARACRRDRARHAHRAVARRDQPQLRDQAVERSALLRDERLRDPQGLRSREGHAHRQPMDRRRMRANGAPR